MSFQDELRNVRDALRRAEEDWFRHEAEIVRLKKELSQAKRELFELRRKSGPKDAARIAMECKQCLYRTEFLKREVELDKAAVGAKMK